MTESTACPGCGFAAPAEDGATHAYMESSPACWRHFNAIMAREYATPELMPTHYLAVDAFAAQHPGSSDDRRARQSTWIHLAGLHAVLRDGHEPHYRYDLLRRLADTRGEWPEQPPHGEFPLVAGQITPELDAAGHIATMQRWAHTTLAAYERANPDLAATLNALG